MRIRRPLITLLGLVLVMAGAPSLATAQEEAPAPVYLEVHCMKSTSADYVEVETSIWQPMHQELVKQGKKDGWALYRVLYGDRSECDYYAVDSYRGLGHLKADPGYDANFATTHPGESWDEALARTHASRVMVRSELWVWIDGVRPSDYQFVVVNQMHADDGAAYVKLEREIWKPVHEALVEGGHRAGWGLYALVAPSGTSLPYNFGTVDFLEGLGPVPLQEAIASVHPTKQAHVIHQESLAVRDHLLAETWVLVAGTE